MANLGVKTAVVLSAIALFINHAHAQSFSCANNNNQVITDPVSGVQYIMRCGSDTTPDGSLNSYYAPTSFNDCFQYCSINANCAAFTYAGGTNGTGSGYCYTKPVQSGNAKSTFSGGSSNTVGVIKLSSYPPLPPSYTCPQAQDLTVVTDPNTGVQYVLRCSSDTFGSSAWSVGASTFNDCFYQCSTNSSGACNSFTFAGGQNGVGNAPNGAPGTCYMKNYSPPGFAQSASDGTYRVGAVQLNQYNGGQGQPYFYPTTASPGATAYPPAATLFFTQINYITSTLLQAIPTTVFSTLTQYVTLTTSITRTTINTQTLPDTTQQVTSLQIIPSTIVTLQIVTVTISTVSIQQVVTVVPTTVIQQFGAVTTNILATASNTQTLVLQSTVTATPTRSYQQTITVTAG